jgi:hypothetical protein
MFRNWKALLSLPPQQFTPRIWSSSQGFKEHYFGEITFREGGTKITQLMPIICVCNSNELTDIQNQLKKKFLRHPSQKKL